MHVNFFDTNIILYLLDNSDKADISERLLSNGGAVSVQVLNESLVNCRKKANMTWLESNQFIDGIRSICKIKSITEATHQLGRALAERYKFSIYDSMIVASALESGCDVLYSEDMQHNMLIEGSLRIINPFSRN